MKTLAGSEITTRVIIGECVEVNLVSTDTGTVFGLDAKNVAELIKQLQADALSLEMAKVERRILL